MGQYKRAEENDIDTYKMYRKIQEQAKVYEEYDNFDREDLIDELVEEKRINEKDLEEINELQDRINKAVSILNDLKYINKYKFTWDREFNKALNILKGSDKE